MAQREREREREREMKKKKKKKKINKGINRSGWMIFLLLQVSKEAEESYEEVAMGMENKGRCWVVVIVNK